MILKMKEWWEETKDKTCLGNGETGKYRYSFYCEIHESLWLIYNSSIHVIDYKLHM